MLSAARESFEMAAPPTATATFMLPALLEFTIHSWPHRQALKPFSIYRPAGLQAEKQKRKLFGILLTDRLNSLEVISSLTIMAECSQIHQAIADGDLARVAAIVEGLSSILDDH